MSSSHVRSMLQALFVTFLWSTSWVLIKFSLEEIPALTFAGLRYALAFLLLLPLVLRREPDAEDGDELGPRDPNSGEAGTDEACWPWPQ